MEASGSGYGKAPRGRRVATYVFGLPAAAPRLRRDALRSSLGCTPTRAALGRAGPRIPRRSLDGKRGSPRGRS
ncbi:unnamed protein product [Lampetra planeri]